LNELAFSPRPGRSIFQRFSLLSMAFSVASIRGMSVIEGGLKL
jgi:hypothetical protein